MTRPEVWLARHGETDWSAAGKHTGRTDIPLNDNGRRAAANLATVLGAERFELVLVSPMQRALETCRLAGFGEQAQVEDNLREWDYGDYEGISSAEIRRQRPGWTVFNDGCPGGETLDQVSARADRVIERVLSLDGRALLFGHGHSLRILAARWIGLSGSAGGQLSLGTATVSVLGWEHESAAISRWNLPAS